MDFVALNGISVAASGIFRRDGRIFIAVPGAAAILTIFPEIASCTLSWYAICYVLCNHSNI